jgi:DNA-binding HxlR family transcriptional regulator
LTVAQVRERKESRHRAGTHALSLLAAPINVAVLEALADGPKALMDLRHAAGGPSQSTLRLRLRELTELGVLHRGRDEGFPRALDYELAASGHELLVVMGFLRTWLRQRPAEPVELGTPVAKGLIKSLAAGWTSTVLRALAAGALTLTELDRLISGLNYPSLERRLGTMHHCGQVEPLPSRERGTPYTVTRWLRQGIAPLAAAARWERLRVADTTAPILRLDIEAAFLLVIPLVALGPELSGDCRLAVETPGGGERQMAGVKVRVEAGRVVSRVTNLEGPADAWASGSAADWLRAVIERDRAGLEIGGDCQLAGDLVDGLHGTLFAAGN